MPAYNGGNILTFLMKAIHNNNQGIVRRLSLRLQ
jgi:serine/threonine protein kinase